MYEQAVLIILGAFISIITTVINKVVDDRLRNKGEIKIFRRLVYRKNSGGESAGFYHGNGGKTLRIPIWIEILNTRKNPIVIRDFSVVLYNKGTRVVKMKQAPYQEEKNNEKWIKTYYGDEGRYSFIIPPESIRKFELLFVLKEFDC